MATTITMPQLGETVTEGTVAQWLKKPGEAVEKYEAFVEISTDKVNAEVPSPVSGVLREIICQEGETVATGAPIAIIDEVGAASETGPAPASAPAPTTAPAPAGAPAVSSQAASRNEADRHGADEPVPRQTAETPVPQRNAGTAVPSSDGTAETSTAVPARTTNNGASGNSAAQDTDGFVNSPDVLRRHSPAVRRLAREHGVDVATLRGTGQSGRVTADDVLAAASGKLAAAVDGPTTETAATVRAPVAAQARSAPPPGTSTYAAPVPGTLVPLSQARKIIAKRMVESLETAPHAWTMVEVDVTNVWAWRARAKERFQQDKGHALTLLPFFMHAVVRALGKQPLLNARFTEDGIQVQREINIGIAIGLDSNLMVPVIRNADSLSIGGLAVAAGKIIDRARAGKLGADELSGGTFTVNNTGANGSVLSKPIINGGQAGIITMEAVVKRPVVINDAIAIRSMMNVCLSLDHRVIDGTIANAFLSDVKKRLEGMGPAGDL